MCSESSSSWKVLFILGLLFSQRTNTILVNMSWLEKTNIILFLMDFLMEKEHHNQNMITKQIAVVIINCILYMYLTMAGSVHKFNN